MKKMRLLAGLVFASMVAVLVGQQAVANDYSTLYTGRPINLGYCQSNYGYGQYCARPSQWYFGAWLETGVYTNSHGNGITRNDRGGYLPRERFGDTDPVTYENFGEGNSFLLGNLQNNRLNINQMAFLLERKMNTNCGFDWGFKTQMLFGTDAYMTQSREDFSLDHNWRSGDYYTTISDLYLSLGYCNLGMKIGKFATPLGYEHSESPNNFFYSHSYGFLQAPNTHAGILADYQINRCHSLFFGWTTGSDAGWSNRFGDSAFLAGIRTTLWQGGTLTYGMMYANLYGGAYKDDVRFSKMYGDYLFPGEQITTGTTVAAPIVNIEKMKAKAYYHSMVFAQNLGRKLDYAAEWYLTNTKVYKQYYNGIDVIDDSGYIARYGIAQYLTYRINCKWGVGLRGEWMHNTIWETDHYAMTVGANWTPVQYLVVRPELRYDWCQGQENQFFNNGKNLEQLSGGCSVMVKF